MFIKLLLFHMLEGSGTLSSRKIQCEYTYDLKGTFKYIYITHNTGASCCWIPARQDRAAAHWSSTAPSHPVYYTRDSVVFLFLIRLLSKIHGRKSSLELVETWDSWICTKMSLGLFVSKSHMEH